MRNSSRRFIAVPCPIDAYRARKVMSCFINVRWDYGDIYTVVFLSDKLRKLFGKSDLALCDTRYVREEVISEFGSYIRSYVRKHFGSDVTGLMKYIQYICRYRDTSSIVMDEINRYIRKNFVIPCIRSFDDLISVMWDSVFEFEVDRASKLYDQMMIVSNSYVGYRNDVVWEWLIPEYVNELDSSVSYYERGRTYRVRPAGNTN